MKASEIQVGMVIDEPDPRGYTVVKTRNPGIPGYVTLYLISRTDHHDRLTHMVPVSADINVIA